MSTNPTPSLLGLPTELRRQIYLKLFKTDLYCTLGEFWRKRPDGDDHENRREQRVNFRVPWLNLMRTCTLMAEEVRSVMNETSFTEDEENVTYAMRFKPTASGYDLGAANWQRIPCRPAQARALIVSIDPRQGLHGSRDREVSGLTNSLGQTLYRFVRAGPRLDVPRDLPQPLSLHEFRVVIENPNDSGRSGDAMDVSLKSSARSSDTRATPWNLFMAISFSEVLGTCVRQGHMSGLVETVRLTLQGKGLLWTVTQTGDVDWRDAAERYGDWGTSSIQDASPE